MMLVLMRSAMTTAAASFHDRVQVPVDIHERLGGLQLNDHIINS